MKKLFITLTVIAGLAFSSKAQEFGFKQGDVLVEGNIGYNSTDEKDTEEKESSFNFNPKAGYFLSDKFAIGVGLSLNSSKFEDYSGASSEIEKSNVLGVGVFGRYYFLEIGKRFKTYAELGAGYVSRKDELEVAGVTTEGKSNGFGIDASVGANYFLTEKIAINFTLANVIGYNSVKADVDGAEGTNNFYLNVNQFNNFFNTATIGLTFKF